MPTLQSRLRDLADAFADQVLGAISSASLEDLAAAGGPKLGMLAKEMPRILKEGVSTKKLTSKGQKRATTYFAK